MNDHSLHEKYNNEDDALESYPMGLSQFPNFFVIDFNHRMTMLKTNASNLENWRCQNSTRLIRVSLTHTTIHANRLTSDITGFIRKQETNG